MDQVFNALNAELPYDRVANGINSSIELFKDGKDTTLLNGQSDINDKTAIVKDFYAKLKKDLTKEHNDTPTSGYTEQIGTEIGHYLVTNQNDIIEKAEEAFGAGPGIIASRDISFNVFKSRMSVLMQTVKRQIATYFGLNNDAKSVFKPRQNSLQNFEASDKLKSDNRKLVDVLLNLDPDDRSYEFSLIPETLTDISSFLRDASAAILPVTKSRFDYYARSSTRARAVSKCINNICFSLDSAVAQIEDNATSGNPRSDPLKECKKFKDYIKDAFKVITNEQKYVKSDDPFVYRMQEYKLDLGSFYMNKVNEVQSTLGLYGIRYSDYKKAKRDASAFDKTTDGPTTMTIKSIGKITDINDLISADSVLGSGKLDLRASSKRWLYLTDICGDMTVGEFYTMAEPLAKILPDLDLYICDAANAIIKDNNISLKNIGVSANKIDAKTRNIKIFDNDKSLKMAKCSFSMAVNTVLDLITTADAIECIVLSDHLKKKQLCNLTTSLLICFDVTIRKALGE